MDEKSATDLSFYRSQAADESSRERFSSLPTAGSPWGPDSQHGGPPAALLGRCVEALLPEAMIGRITVELLGPVPLGTLATRASLTRPGRSVQLVTAELYDESRGRAVAAAYAWMFPRSTDGPTQPTPLDHSPSDGVAHARPPHWGAGYLDAVEWRWIEGAVESPGPGVVWMRTPGLVEGEQISPTQRLLACVDSASGVSSVLDLREWLFLNTELTVHVLREPVGEWLCLDAETTLGPGSVGVATSRVYDQEGLVARSAQALLVQRR